MHKGLNAYIVGYVQTGPCIHTYAVSYMYKGLYACGGYVHRGCIHMGAILIVGCILMGTIFKDHVYWKYGAV